MGYTFSLYRWEKVKAKRWLIGVIGNILEHYDNALYGLLVPFLAPLFFPEQDPVTQLIMGYGIMPLGMIARPAGSLFFGWIGDVFGREKALSLSLLGMAFVTMAMGCLPVYSDIGVLAPILLALLRMLQSFFMAGETVNGAVFVLEKSKEKNRSFISSIYDASTVAGILLASLLVTMHATLDLSWRWLFWAGSCTALFGLAIRREEASVADLSKKRVSLKGKWPLICTIASVSGFTHITYIFGFTLMNGLLPLITDLSKADVMKVNSLLLLLDMLFLPVCGYLAKLFGRARIMKGSALLLAFGAVPLLMLLENASLTTCVVVRTVIVSLGVAFAAPYHAWAVDQVDEEDRCTVLSFGYSLGSQLIGAPTCACVLYLFHQTNSLLAPAAYLLLFALVAFYQIAKPGKYRSLPLEYQ